MKIELGREYLGKIIVIVLLITMAVTNDTSLCAISNFETKDLVIKKISKMFIMK